VRYHMQPCLYVRVCLLLIWRVWSEDGDADAQEVALLALCDRYGRIGADRHKEQEDIRLFPRTCRQI
jgi:hypothetical protein